MRASPAAERVMLRARLESRAGPRSLKVMSPALQARTSPTTLKAYAHRRDPLAKGSHLRLQISAPLVAVASLLVAVASLLVAVATLLVAVASLLVAVASLLVAVATLLVAVASLLVAVPRRPSPR